MSSRIVNSQNFALCSALSETTRNANSVKTAQHFFCIFFGDFLGIYQLDVNLAAVCRARVTNRFHNRDISVRQRNIFSDKPDCKRFYGAFLTFYHFFPFGKVGLSVLKPEQTASRVRETFFFEHKRNGVQRRSCQILDNVLFSDVAEIRDFLAHFNGHFHFAAQNEDIRLDTEREQLLDGVLSGLGFKLV